MRAISKTLILLLFGLSLTLGLSLSLSQSTFAVTLTTSSVPPEFAQRHYFDQAHEFPNYFLPEQYRGLPLEQIPPQVVQETRTALEAAITSLHQRMDWSVFLPGKPDIQNVKLLPLLISEAQKIDPAAKLYTSGGLLRSMLSYLYREMDRAAKAQKPGTPLDGLQFLKDFAKDTRPISDGAVRGVGSDLDLLIDHSQNSEAVKNGVMKLINHGLEAYSGEGARIAEDRLGFVRTVFLQGDVKDYGPQIARSSSEGGSTLDWLAFDLKTGKFQEPTRDPHVIDHFIRGYFTYLAPTAKIAPGEHAGTVLRGIRPMLELPHLKVKGQEVFEQEVREQVAWMAKGNAPFSNDLMQIQKMSRNAISGGAQNRFYRTRPGTLDADLKGWLSQIEKKTQARIPIVAYQEQIAGRVIAPGHELPAEVFISPDRFIASHTKDGNLYHGTKSVEGMLSILRGGFYMSMGDVQGVASFGSGVYTTPDLEVAQSFAGDTGGRVLTLKVRKDPSLRILDWEKAKNFQKFKEIERWCKEHQVDLFEYLSREYHIDAIVNQHVVVQNGQLFDLDHAEQLFASVRAEFAEGQKKFVESIDAKIASKKFEALVLMNELQQSPYKVPIKPSWTDALIEKDPNSKELYKYLHFVAERGELEENSIAKWVARVKMDKTIKCDVLVDLFYTTGQDYSKFLNKSEFDELIVRVFGLKGGAARFYIEAYNLRNPKLVQNMTLTELSQDWYRRVSSFESFKEALLRAEKLGVHKDVILKALEHAYAKGLGFTLDGVNLKNVPLPHEDPELRGFLERLFLDEHTELNVFKPILYKIPPTEVPSIFRKFAQDPRYQGDVLAILWQFESDPVSELYREIFDQIIRVKNPRVITWILNYAGSNRLKLYPQGLLHALKALEEVDPQTFETMVGKNATFLEGLPESRKWVPSGPITPKSLSQAFKAQSTPPGSGTLGPSLVGDAVAETPVPKAQGPAPSSVHPQEAQLLNALENSLKKGQTIDSHQVTQLMGQLNGKLSAQGLTRVQGLFSQFKTRTDPISGYSYINRGFQTLVSHGLAPVAPLPAHCAGVYGNITP